MNRVSVVAGDRFGRLTVIAEADQAAHWVRRFLCRCDCGGESIVRISALRGRKTLSCGCLRSEHIAAMLEKRKARSVTGTPEHCAWIAMLARCHNEDHTDYANYGGRGIFVCERWRKSFADFLADVGYRPKGPPRYTIERIDNNRGYEPGNVKWATFKDQACNRRSTTPITYRGETMPLLYWAKRLGINQPTLRRRIFELGWSIEKAMETPTNLYHHR